MKHTSPHIPKRTLEERIDCVWSLLGWGRTWGKLGQNSAGRKSQTALRESGRITQIQSAMCMTSYRVSASKVIWGNLPRSVSPLTGSSLIPVSRQLIVCSIKSENCIVLFHQVGQAGCWPALRLWCAHADRGYDSYCMAISSFSDSPQECSVHSRTEVKT